MNEHVSLLVIDPATDMPSGERRCDECFGDPRQYLIDVGVPCPTCRGLGSFPDPDACSEDDDGPDWSPQREWGTHVLVGGKP